MCADGKWFAVQNKNTIHTHVANRPDPFGEEDVAAQLGLKPLRSSSVVLEHRSLRMTATFTELRVSGGSDRIFNGFDHLRPIRRLSALSGR